MFTVTKKSQQSNARIGRITTAHGSIQTPVFLPDATRATIRSLTNDDFKRLGLQSMVVNTYHLYLQPGMKRMKKHGGVHAFMQWDKPLVSDSGGYQVFSLAHKNKGMGRIRDTHVDFRSPHDGAWHKMTPQKSIQTQFDIGADIIVCFDEPPPNDASKKDVERAVERTIAWAHICKKEYEKQVTKRKLKTKRPLLVGVIQGALHTDLRMHCAQALVDIGFDGYGFGGRPVDAHGNFMGDMLQATADVIPNDTFKFSLGMGKPEDIVRCVQMGWDVYDCVIPTREARHGRLYEWKATKNKEYNLLKNFYTTSIVTNAQYAKDLNPINPDSRLEELRTYTKSYLHHLFKTQEPLAWRLATLHNLEFYLDLMKKIRTAIKEHRL